MCGMNIAIIWCPTPFPFPAFPGGVPTNTFINDSKTANNKDVKEWKVFRCLYSPDCR